MRDKEKESEREVGILVNLEIMEFKIEKRYDI